MQRKVVILYRRFETRYCSHLNKSRNPCWNGGLSYNVGKDLTLRCATFQRSADQKFIANYSENN